MEKELTITGFYQGVDKEKLSDYIHNEEHLTVVASEGCPAFLGGEVNRVATTRRVKPSVVWHELIEAGARELILKWKSSDNTNVSKALSRIHTTGKMYSVLHGMVRAFDSHSNGVFMGCQVVVILQDSLFLDDWDNEDEAYLDTLCSEWGLDFGDACMLFAAVAGKQIGLRVLYQESLDRTEKYLREKCWFINALVNQSINPLSKSVLETAEELLYGKGVR